MSGIRLVERERLFLDLPEGAIAISDETVASHFELPKLTLLVPPGESSKSLATYGRILDQLADSGATRRTTLVAIGGGVVGDLAGFVAATYMRGVPFIQIPTTLLAQVDSSVGGKVGIDLPQGKNLVGAFWPAQEVRICIDALSSLPTRQFTNGMAEVLKYGLILDANLWNRLSETPLRPTSSHLETIVLRCIRLKEQVVAADPEERSGLRAILNFGHTIGHAIEALEGYEGILHGEAIAVGMRFEADLGERIGMTPPGTAEIIRAVLQRYGLPTDHPRRRDVESMLAKMRRDKKAVNGQLAFSLLSAIGECRLMPHVEESQVREVLQTP